MSRIVKIAAGVIVLVLLVGLVSVLRGDSDIRRGTAFFNRTVALYEGSDVRVLGVPVGKVERIRPRGTSVEVQFNWDAAMAQVPQDAGAVIVTPTVVADRYIQLAPVHTGGPTLQDGAVIPLDRTSEPVELDQIFNNLTELGRALGPEGANENGALNDLLQVSAANLEGNGQELNTTLTEFSALVSTLSENRDDLFGMIRNLQVFTTALAENDDAVRAFNESLTETADLLDDQKEDLRLALENLGIALGDVQGFVADNRDLLISNVEGLTSVTTALLSQRAALEEFIDVVPTGLTNLNLAYNATSGTLDTRSNLSVNLEDPLNLLCGVLEEALTDLGGFATCQELLGALLSGQLPDPQLLIDQLNQFLPGLGDTLGGLAGGGGGGLLGAAAATGTTPPADGPAPAGAGAAAPAPPQPPALPGYTTEEGRDLTLGGILPLPGGLS